ncbi:putative ATP-dependent RNA helicase DHX34 isoform X2 [Haematobia irritans]|uniref:putative ATP-dependent RNA helicase DHX34 isoform X2 n=1 Tax=Haematobia irritans TaxID=7368 RepID=UPI003F4FC7B9
MDKSKIKNQVTNLTEFSFCDFKSSFDHLLSSRDMRHNIIEDRNDFWKFVNKYEAMLKNIGQSILPQPLEEEMNDMSKTHKLNCIPLRLSEDAKKSTSLHDSHATTLRMKQFQEIMLIYLDFKQKERFAKIKKLRKTQQNLPIYKYKSLLKTSLNETRVLIVAGDTGCGKSTQVPQYLYEFGYKSIACTQPRRLACISLSKRVAHEMLDDYGSKVGFQIRFEKNKTQHTNILFITEGLLLRQLALESNLEQYDVLILDEIHERNLFGDFLLGVTKCLLRAKPNLKLILMSATINVELFHSYFKEEGAKLLQVPGRLYPIKTVYMPPPSLELQAKTSSRSQKASGRLDPAPFVQVLNLIDEKYSPSDRGDVLIFVSGVNEITTVCDAAKEYAEQQSHWIILPLHSGLSLAEQDKVFDYAPEAMRKCIVSTNIAETSLTVDGIRFVVDSGKVKEMSYDSSCKGQRLKEFWVSKSSAEQRKGRAGRTGPGNALTPDEKITALGKSLSNLPVDISIGKMLLMGCVFPDVEKILTLAAVMSVQNPFTNRAYTDPKCEEARAHLESDQGDIFTLLRAYHEWLQLKWQNRENTRKWCHKLGIEEQRFYEITKLRNQFQNILESCNMTTNKFKDDHLTSSERAKRHGEVRMLKAIKRKQKYQEPRKRKLLKHHNNEAEDNFDDGEDDIRDVDFRLYNDAAKLEILIKSSKTDKLRDVLLLKLVIVSGFYPKIAISDEFNYCKGGSQQFFHTFLKPFISIHPNSYFAKCFDILKLNDSDILEKPSYYLPKQPLSEAHQILCYQNLLETAKPYLVNCIRMPAAQCLLLFSYNIETNASISRVICDSWLCLEFPTPEAGCELLCRAINLRRLWNRLLMDKLTDLEQNVENQKKKSENKYLEEDLWYDLVKLMSINVAYTIKRLLPADLKTLYTHRPLENIQGCKINPFAKDFSPTPNTEKGGINICENVVFNCLQDQQWTLQMDKEMCESLWTCKYCDTEFEFNVIDKLIHKTTCNRSQKSTDTVMPSSQPPQSPAASSSGSGKNKTLYQCAQCSQDLYLSNIDILKHKKLCVNK